MTKPITFITGNADKAEQLSKYLNMPINHHKLDLTEVQSLDLEEITKLKALEAYKQLKKAVIVDDVSLRINLLGKLPGPFIKFFTEEIGNEGICKLISGLPDKSATATVSIGFYDGINIKIFSGNVNGKISDYPKGSGGFGWDQIFIPDGYSQTRSEMNEKDYDNTSPRKFALEKLEIFLNDKYF